MQRLLSSVETFIKLGDIYRAWTLLFSVETPSSNQTAKKKTFKKAIESVLKKSFSSSDSPESEEFRKSSKIYLITFFSFSIYFHFLDITWG